MRARLYSGASLEQLGKFINGVPMPGSFLDSSSLVPRDTAMYGTAISSHPSHPSALISFLMVTAGRVIRPKNIDP